MKIIPKELRECIEKKCGIRLTADFADKRLLVYENDHDPQTVRFVRLYGEDHLENVRSWFLRIARDI